MENGGWEEENKVSFYFDSDRDVSPPSTGIGSSPSPPRDRHGCIEHPVSKFDTLAGIAIKYGVEVADIRKMNGLVTDRQIFALKTINIPLPGKHPPSPCLSYDASTPSTESFHSFKGRNVSQAMTSLQGYYGLKPPSEEDTCYTPNPPLHQSRKSRSLVDIILEEILEKGDAEEAAAQVRQGGVSSAKLNDKLMRRRQKSEADFSRIPELLLKEDNGSTSRTGKPLTLRQKVGSRNALTTDSESRPGDASYTECSSSSSSSGVRKSYSTPCFQDQHNGCTSSMWPPSMWTLKPDSQVLPKPTARKK